MNQQFRQILSTVQQIKLQQLRLEVETLERQLEDVLELERNSSARKINQLDQLEQLPHFIYLNETVDSKPIRLIHDVSS